MSLLQALKQGFFRVFSLVFSLSNAPKTVFKALLHSIIARRLPRANPAIGSAYDPLNKPQECHRDSPLSATFLGRMWLNINHLLDDFRPPTVARQQQIRASLAGEIALRVPSPHAMMKKTRSMT